MRRKIALLVFIAIAFALVFGVKATQAQVVESVTCAEALIHLKKVIRGFDLSDDDLDEIDELILKAKLE